MVLAVFAAGVALYRHVQDETDNAPDRDALPVVGQTLVGFEDVAVPLPSGWSIDDYRCGQPQSNTVAIPPLGPVRGVCVWSGAGRQRHPAR